MTRRMASASKMHCALGRAGWGRQRELMNVDYESDQLLAEYLLFHYGSAEEVLPSSRVWPDGMVEALGFPLRTVGYFSQGHVARALDLGCAVGRSAFELAKSSERVVGLDYSHRFIEVAQRLARGERLVYERLEEGRQSTTLVASAPIHVDPSRLAFVTGNAMDLPEDLGAFDRVHAANLICRLSNPILLLERLPGLVAGGGELLLATPCTWLESFTPPANWPVGSTLDWLRRHLGECFELKSETEESFLIRETARKFQWSSSMVTVWRKN